MPSEQSQELIIITVGDLGPGNQGEFGPDSEAEQEAVKDIQDERYWGPRLEKSACMDDRLEGLRLHLAGNRAVSEVAAGYMDRRLEELALSRAMSRKVHELVTMGRVPVFHEKCAALASIRPALDYIAGNEDIVVGEVWRKLDALGSTEFLTEQQLRDAVKIGLRRSQNESLWDSAPEQLMKIAAENGAEIEETPGEHKIAGNLDVMTNKGFNNGLFRREHLADDGEPMGLLTIDWLGYRDQLLEDGFSQEDAARTLMRTGLFIVGVQKMINKDGSPLVTAGRY